MFGASSAGRSHPLSSGGGRFSHSLSSDSVSTGREIPLDSASWEANPASLASSTAAALVHQLENLHEGPLVFHKVVQLGEIAIPALERLVRGPSQSLYHSRSLGVDALAAIGTPAAVQALTRSLRDSIERAPDPASLEAESILVNHIAEHLARFSDPEVSDALLTALRIRPYPYCAAALGLIGEPRAVPLLVDCLFEDSARPAAAAALKRFGRAALAPLVQALRRPHLVAGDEPPTRVDGRVAAAKLVGECVGADPLVDAVALPALSSALSDRQRSVRVEAALALARCNASLGAEAAGILVMALDEPNWARAHTIVGALVYLGAAVEGLIVAMLGVRPRNEQDRRRRLRAVEVAGRLGSPAAIARLQHLSGSSDVKLRLAAVAALSAIPALDAPCLARFLGDPEPAVRRHVLQALLRRHLVPLDSATRLLADADPDVRRLATAGVRDNLAAALPALHLAAYGFGAPLHGWMPRWRLWWHACALISAAPRLHRRVAPRGVVPPTKRHSLIRELTVRKEP